VVDTILDKSTDSIIYLPVDKLHIAFLRDIKVTRDYVELSKSFSGFEFRVLSEAEYVIHPE